MYTAKEPSSPSAALIIYYFTALKVLRVSDRVCDISPYHTERLP